MRRRHGAKELPKPAVQRCPGCGATASASALRCTVCGQPFASAAAVSQLWGPVDPPAGQDAPLLDLYASDGGGRVFRAGDAPVEPRRGEAAAERGATLPSTLDPWASSSGTLAALPGKPDSGGFVAPSSAAPEARAGTGGRGLRRALTALLLILVVGGAAAWLGGRPYLSQRVAADVGAAIDDRLEDVPALPADGRGRVTVVERDITAALRANADAYAPITDPRVALSRNGVRVTFALYGQAHTLTGTLAVVEGRLTVQDPVLDGPGRRLIEVADVTAAAEEAIADMFARLDARPVSAKTSDDTLVIQTEPT